MPQKSKNYQDALKKKGIEFECHLILKKSQAPYINSKSYAQHVKSAFIPHIEHISAETGIEQKEAVLLQDNCPSRLSSPMM
jgi:hypothetical protein